MTSGQNKGAMLLMLLHQAKEQPEAVVYDDDNIRHVANVYTAVRDRGNEITAFHYTKRRSEREGVRLRQQEGRGQALAEVDGDAGRSAAVNRSCSVVMGA